MIYKIQKKEYDEIKRRRKTYGQKKGVAILFKCANGFYYKQDQTDFGGLAEVERFKKNVAEQVGKQESLL